MSDDNDQPTATPASGGPGSSPAGAAPAPAPALKSRASIYVPVSLAEMEKEAATMIDPATVDPIRPSWQEDGVDFVDEHADGHFLAKKLVALDSEIRARAAAKGESLPPWDTRLYFRHPLLERYSARIAIPDDIVAQTYLHAATVVVVAAADQSPEATAQRLSNLNFNDLEEFKSHRLEGSDDGKAELALRDLHRDPGDAQG